MKLDKMDEEVINIMKGHPSLHWNLNCPTASSELA